MSVTASLVPIDLSSAMIDVARNTCSGTAVGGFGYRAKVTFSRPLRSRLIAMLALAILFAQVAISAYACPATAGRAEVAAADMAGMPCAAMMADGTGLDPEQPALCLQHCQFGAVSQLVDHASTVLTSALALPPTRSLTVRENDLVITPGPERERRRDRPPTLAHCIVHCCYRI